MKAIIYNQNSALIVDVYKYTCEDNIFHLRLTVNPVIDMDTSVNNTILVDVEDKEKNKEVAFNIAQSLVGKEGQVTTYNPKTSRKILKYTNK